MSIAFILSYYFVIFAHSADATNSTICDSDLCTWWHATGEINTDGKVQPGNVRQSRRYLIQVSKAGTNIYYNSFVYESVPRNGNGKIYSPWDAPNSSTFQGDDGVSIEPSIGVNMAWSQFEYNVDVEVKISIMNASSNCVRPFLSMIKIRPQTMYYYSIRSSEQHAEDEPEDVIIFVPKDINGRKFSIEFDNDLFIYRSDGKDYLPAGDVSGDIVGVEPTNALLIFASPSLPSNMIPLSQGTNVKLMKPGPINQGDWLVGAPEILYFGPGIYWMNSNANGTQPKYGELHMKLHANTYWVYLAPGAYVKGAIEYTTTSHSTMYATGHGVLSGENYVYQANVDVLYQALKSDGVSLRMWWHRGAVAKQVWYCYGPTLTSPPFNSMDLFGSSDISVQIADYKQVGAFFYQTDGPQMYPNSVVRDTFYHVNDDGIKTYYSGVFVLRAIIWKITNDPIIQMGWDSRDVNNVSIRDLYVIHTRYKTDDTYVPTALIGASPLYDPSKIPRVDPSKSISMTINNLVCEGVCPSLLRVTPLQNYRNFVINNVTYLDTLQVGKILHTGQSEIFAAADQILIAMQLRISNWTIGGVRVTMDNWQANELGQFNIDASYWGQWLIS